MLSPPDGAGEPASGPPRTGSLGDAEQGPALRLVYFAGAHKSGATPLGTVLGVDLRAFFGGELYRFPHPIFDPGQGGRQCSCGRTLDGCPFWTAVRSRAAAEGEEFLDQLRAGQLRYERWRSLPLTLWRAYDHDPELTAHLQRMVAFLRLLAEESGAQVIVESSYNPLRGWLYGRAERFGLSVRHIHLVRDGRTFVASERTASDAPEVSWRWVRAIPVIVGRWVVSHLLSVALLRRRGRYLRVRFEDVVTSPRERLPALAAFTGLDLSEAFARIGTGEAIPMRHVVAGNRLRLEGKVVLQPEFARRGRLSAGATATFWVLGGWLALWLGYRPRLDRGPPASS